MRIIACQYHNHLVRALLANSNAIDFSPSVSSKFPARNAGDNIVSKYVQWNVVPGGSGDPETPDPGLERHATIDQCLIKNPGAESSMSGWKKTGTVTSSTEQANVAIVAGSVRSFKVTSGSTVFQIIPMRSGERARITFAVYGAGSGAGGGVQVKDDETGRHLQADGTWGDTAAILGQSSTASWTPYSLTFLVEPYKGVAPNRGTGKHITKLRITGVSEGGTSYLDDICVISAIDFCGCFGVGFPFQMAPTVYSSDTEDFAVSTTRFEMEPFQPSFYSHVATPFLARYLDFVLPGVREAAFKPYLGELVFAQSVELQVGETTPRSFSSRFGSEAKHAWLSAKKATGKAVSREKGLAAPTRAVRALNLPFRWFEGAWDQAREWFVLRRRGERDNIIIFAPEFESEMVIYGGFSGEVGYTPVIPGVADGGIQITEDEFPKPPKGEFI